METLELASRLSGAVWGHLVGDAIGVPYEFRSADAIGEVVLGAHGTHRQPVGTWSDDGALMLALLDSLLEKGFDPEDQGRRALAWDREGAYTPDGDGRFDIGITTSAALRALARGTPAVEAGPGDGHACGNGSLMRILPLALVDRDADERMLIERAHLASRVTHGHPRCQVTCALYVLVARGLLHGDGRREALASARSAVRAAYAVDPDLGDHLFALDELDAWTGRSGRGYVIDSFWSAWDAFAGASSYQETIVRAVRYGDDTDTTAAIAGGLAGIRWGWEGIPTDWRRAMRGREVATPLVDRLVGTAGPRTSTASPLRVDPLDVTGLDGLDAGRVGITFLPGKKRDGYTGPHWRDLDLDVERLHAAAVDTLLLLVEDSELLDCRVQELPDVLASAGIELVRFPIRDPRIPVDHAAYRAVIRDMVERVRGGRSVAVACRGGIDRSGMTAACVLVETGLGVEAAIDRVHHARRGTLTLGEQLTYVRGWPHAG